MPFTALKFTCANLCKLRDNFTLQIVICKTTLSSNYHHILRPSSFCSLINSFFELIPYMSKMRCVHLFTELQVNAKSGLRPVPAATDVNGL